MAKQALEAKRLNAFSFDPDDLVIVGLDTKDGKEHPLYDERIHLALEETFIRNVQAFGVLQAVTVRKNGDKAEVVAGRQRVRAAREANKRLKAAGCEPIMVPVMIRRGDDSRMFGVMISENENRAADDMNVKLDKLQRYLATGKDENDAATAFGVSLQTIKNWLSLLEAAPQVRKAIDTGKISPTAGMKIARLPREQQVEVLATEVATAPANNGASSANSNGASPRPGRVSAARIERVTRAKREESNGNGKAHDYEIPGKRVLRHLLDNSIPVGNSDDYNAGFRAAVAWILGQKAPTSIKGLQAATKTVEL
jgi:ParB family chromosome partitioning protein